MDLRSADKLKPHTGFFSSCQITCVLLSAKLKNASFRVREFSELEEVDPFRTQRPIWPAPGIHVDEHFAFFAALQRHAPDTSLLVFRIIKVTSVKRLHRRDSSVLRQLQGCSALYRHFPDLERFCLSFRGEIYPFPVS